MQASEIIVALMNQMWKRYLDRVVYAKQYKELVEAEGGTPINDHCAFRTLYLEGMGQPAGIEGLARVFEPLGYKPAEHYVFINKNLTAWHYEHPNETLPKLFISQLEVSQLPPETAMLIAETVKGSKDPLTKASKELLEQLKLKGKLSKDDAAQLVKGLLKVFARPWNPPKRTFVEEVNRGSQYGAWTLLHGNAVNHFTAYINHQNVPKWPDIEATIKGLADHGIPMKNQLEGEPGSKLRQSSTQAVIESCEVEEEDGSKGEIDWSYAYYELAERNMVKDADGNNVLFNAFLGEQATHLFDMTTYKKG